MLSMKYQQDCISRDKHWYSHQLENVDSFGRMMFYKRSLASNSF